MILPIDIWPHKYYIYSISKGKQMTKETSLFLGDMEGLSENDVFDHIVQDYAPDGDHDGVVSESDAQPLRESLSQCRLLIAYESVGHWGCDSTSWFLLEDLSSGILYVIQGFHDSCFGFEGQGEMESTCAEYLLSDNFYFPTGGYDEDSKKNTQLVKDKLQELFG